MTDEPEWGRILTAAAQWAVATAVVAALGVVGLGTAARREAQAAERERHRVRWTDANRWER